MKYKCIKIGLISQVSMAEAAPLPRGRRSATARSLHCDAPSVTQWVKLFIPFMKHIIYTLNWFV